jgi:hypothetical protein
VRDVFAVGLCVLLSCDLARVWLADLLLPIFIIIYAHIFGFFARSFLCAEFAISFLSFLHLHAVNLFTLFVCFSVFQEKMFVLINFCVFLRVDTSSFFSDTTNQSIQCCAKS